MLQQKHPKIVPVLCSMMLVFMVSASYANANDGIAVQDAHHITKTINEKTTEQLDKKQLILENVSKSINDSIRALQQSIISVTTWGSSAKRDVMPYYDEFKDLLSERVLSRFGVEQVTLKLDEIANQMASSYKNVENSTTAGDANPFANTVARGDSRVYEILTTTFCNPDSMMAPESCRNAQSTPHSNENFVGMFLGERTWANNTIIDALLVARRFFAPAQTRDYRGYRDDSNFLSARADMTQSNLRMAILNTLAARRAPTSAATGTALEFMFKILANSSPFVMTTDASKACSTENLTYSQEDPDDLKAIKFMNGYVCSFTSAPIAGTGERLISEAAIDRIMQHDFYLSADFYGTINSTSVHADTLDKMEVFMKAQQLAQDYRQLRLLQMKVAATAMNIMNK